MWAPLLPTPVTQAMFWWDRPPAHVRMQTQEKKGYRIQVHQYVKVYTTALDTRRGPVQINVLKLQ